MPHPREDLLATLGPPVGLQAPGFPAKPHAGGDGPGGGQAAADPVCTGLAKSQVHGSFMLVVRTAQGLGLETGMGPDAHEKQSENEGLSYMEATLARIKQTIHALPMPGAAHLSLVDHLIQTQAAITAAQRQPDAQSDYPGVERRSAQAAVEAQPGLSPEMSAGAAGR